MPDEDGSLLFPGESLWTEPNFSELIERFNKNPGKGERFEDKLQGQLGTDRPDVIRLMAELIATHYLFVTSVGGRRKRELMREVLSFESRALAMAPERHGLTGAGEQHASDPLDDTPTDPRPSLIP
jgi:5-methylcytosine-specific restriction protein B